jgi:hypothetical protein
MAKTVSDWQAAHHHVRIPNGLDFVYVVMADYGIEASVQIIQKVYYLEKERKSRWR